MKTKTMEQAQEQLRVSITLEHLIEIIRYQNSYITVNDILVWMKNADFVKVVRTQPTLTKESSPKEVFNALRNDTPITIDDCTPTSSAIDNNILQMVGWAIYVTPRGQELIKEILDEY